jgi:UDP-N-acetylmuramate: L-alanyl-gamma-D-glutamyl-meso-diaminopimelate ligase
MQLHILGICGTFMGGLALIARAAGHTVTGCDAGVYPPMSTQLEEQGIRLIEGFNADQLELKPDLFIIGNVITRGNPLMEAILDQGLPYTSGPQWLGENVLRTQRVLAVAGTHGKTTTSSMLAWILEHAGKAPNFLIGGVAVDLKVSARYRAEQNLFVIEADEYDTAFFDKRSKFVHYRPRTAILNNLEYDHADIFPDLKAIETQFHHLIRTIPGSGHIIRPTDSAALDRVLALGCWSSIETFGPRGQWQAIDSGPTGHIDIIHNSVHAGTIAWQLTGRHNSMNALAALAAAERAGVPARQGVAALSAFRGVKRRMELRGTINQIKIYDDFAHHPTAIAATIDGLRRKIGNGRILAVIEPRSNTMRLGAMAAQLPDALKQADQVFCFGATSGKHALGWDPKQVLAPLGERASSFDNLNKMIDAISATALSGDSILVMSNGSFGGIHQTLLDRLQNLNHSQSIAQASP